jgi:hypothetical protein
LSPRPGLAYLLVGATGLAVLILLLLLTGTPEPQRIAWVAAYALVLVCVVSVLHGFLLAARGYATRPGSRRGRRRLPVRRCEPFPEPPVPCCASAPPRSSP